MPELLDDKAVQAALGEKAAIGYGLASAPIGTFDVPTMQPIPLESFFHPVQALDDLIQAINRNTEQTSLLVKDMLRERTFVDRAVQIGATIAYTVDYLEHKYLYALAGSALTLSVSTGGTLALTANVWQNISLPRGTQFTIQGGSDSSPDVVQIRACDVRM